MPCVFGLKGESMDIKLNTNDLKKGEWIYLSGPMTGLPDFNAESFRERSRLLQENIYLNVHVFDPSSLSEWYGKHQSHEFYMLRALRRLLRADVLYAFGDCSKSKGAALEQRVAKECGIRIVYEGPEACLYV